MLISILDATAPDQANRIRQIARTRSEAWDCPYYVALDYTLIEIERRVCEKTGETFRLPECSCRLYEEGLGQ